MHISRINFFVCFSISLISSLNLSFAQNIDRSVFSTNGRFAVNSGIEVNYNIGESVVFTAIGTTAVLTQGFEQKDVAEITLTNSANSVMYANAFPNPVSEKLYITFNSSKISADIELEVFDIQGNRINIDCFYPPAFSLFNFILDFSAYKAGVYFIKLSSFGNNYSSTIKICKI